MLTGSHTGKDNIFSLNKLLDLWPKEGSTLARQLVGSLEAIRDPRRDVAQARCSVNRLFLKWTIENIDVVSMR